MKWKHSGIIYEHENVDYSAHVQLPVVNSTSEDVWKIYFSCRDSKNESQPFFIDVNAQNPKEILSVSRKPLFRKHPDSTFDQHGIMPTEFIHHRGREYLFYIGWSRASSYPYQNFIGLAISENGNWQARQEPVLLGNKESIYTGTLGLIALREKYYGYFLSCCDWPSGGDPLYRIDIASSEDLTDWQCEPALTAINLMKPDEGGACAARIFYAHDCFHMFYCFRNQNHFREKRSCGYRLGYAQSKDALSWQRMDNLVKDFDKGASYTQTMCCYPYIVIKGDKLHIFYNGDGFGETGLAHAVMELENLPTFTEK